MCKYVYRPIDPSLIKTELLCVCFAGQRQGERSATNKRRVIYATTADDNFTTIISTRSSASFYDFQKTSTLLKHSPLIAAVQRFWAPFFCNKNPFGLINLAKFDNKMTLWKQQTLPWIILRGSQQTYSSGCEQGRYFNKQARTACMSQ